MSKWLKVVLVGLPGSGKSTFGRQLAHELRFPYLDLDHQIEEKFQLKIPTERGNSENGKLKRFRNYCIGMLRLSLRLEEEHLVLTTIWI
jgi:shikimate kinase